MHTRANRGTHVDPNLYALGCADEGAHNTNTNGGTHGGTNVGTNVSSVQRLC